MKKSGGQQIANYVTNAQKEPFMASQCHWRAACQTKRGRKTCPTWRKKVDLRGGKRKTARRRVVHEAKGLEGDWREREMGGTRPDTRHKMRLVCVFSSFENNMGRTDLRTDGQTDRRTDRRTDTASYRDSTAHLKTKRKETKGKQVDPAMFGRNRMKNCRKNISS